MKSESDAAKVSRVRCSHNHPEEQIVPPSPPYHHCKTMIHPECMKGSLRLRDEPNHNEYPIVCKDEPPVQDGHYCLIHLPRNCELTIKLEHPPHFACSCEDEFRKQDVSTWGNKFVRHRVLLMQLCPFPGCNGAFHTRCMEGSVVIPPPLRYFNLDVIQPPLKYCKYHLHPECGMVISRHLPSYLYWWDQYRRALIAKRSSVEMPESVSTYLMSTYNHVGRQSIAVVHELFDSATAEEVEALYPAYMHLSVQRELASIVEGNIRPSDFYLFVSPHSAVGLPLEFGLKCTRDIPANTVMMNYGGILRSASDVRARTEVEIPRSHMINLMNGGGDVLDGMPSRRAMVSFVPSTQEELDYFISLPPCAWGYDPAVMSAIPLEYHSMLKSGIGFMVNSPIRYDGDGQKVTGSKANAHFNTIHINGPDRGLTFARKVIKSTTFIAAGEEILCKYKNNELHIIQ